MRAHVSTVVVGVDECWVQEMDRDAGLAGFQWMFLLYGIAVVFTVVVAGQAEVVRRREGQHGVVCEVAGGEQACLDRRGCRGSLS